MKGWFLIGVAVLGLGALATGEIVPRATQAAPTRDLIERGRYLVRIGGCNDCHTPHFVARNGEVAEERWLIGDSVGYSGPWGTTYPSNLRNLLASMDEDAWVRYAQTLETRPPMPWFNLRAFAETTCARCIAISARCLPTTALCRNTFRRTDGRQRHIS